MKESTSLSVSLTLGRGQDARTWVNCFEEYSLEACWRLSLKILGLEISISLPIWQLSL